MHSIQNPFDYAEGDKSPHIDIGKLDLVLRMPLLHTLTLIERSIELHNCHSIDNLSILIQRENIVLLHSRNSHAHGTARSKGSINIPCALPLHGFIFNYDRELGGGGIDGVE